MQIGHQLVLHQLPALQERVGLCRGYQVIEIESQLIHAIILYTTNVMFCFPINGSVEFRIFLHLVKLTQSIFELPRLLPLL